MTDPAARYSALFARRAAKPVAALFRAGAASSQDVIPLTYGFPDPGSFPFAALAAASGRVLDDGGDTALQYGPIAGDERFREHVAERLQGDGLDVAADNIIVTSGGSQGIQLVTELVVDPGDAVIVEAPSFIGARSRRFATPGRNCTKCRLMTSGCGPTSWQRCLPSSTRPASSRS